ncbi:MAG: hypothetical protein FWC82_00205 [Firmicutes bacterium]|nr:hypothetical protein [Bacillota bacterium]
MSTTNKNQNFASLKDEELEKSVEKDIPEALTEKALRALAKDDLITARKFLTFASMLGDKKAHIALAGIHEEEDCYEEAYELYVKAYQKGDDSVLPKLTRLLMMTDKALALEVLQAHANEGHVGCIEELIEISEKNGNAQEAMHWKALLEQFEG